MRAARVLLLALLVLPGRAAAQGTATLGADGGIPEVTLPEPDWQAWRSCEFLQDNFARLIHWGYHTKHN